MIRQGAFTLLELLIVVIVVGVLASAAVPSLSRSIRRSRAVEAQQAVGNLLTAELAYYQQYKVFTSGSLALDIPFPGGSYSYDLDTSSGATVATVTATGSTPATTNIVVIGTVYQVGTTQMSVDLGGK